MKKHDELEKRIFQSNTLVLAKSKLSLNEKKVLLCMIAELKRDDIEFRRFLIPMRKLIALIGLDKSKSAYSRIRKIVKDLNTAPLYIPAEDIDATWVAAAKYHRYGDYKGLVEFEFAEMLMPYLLGLVDGNYNKYFLKYAMALHSSPAIGIYELMKVHDWKKMPIRISMYDLRDHLNMHGKYLDFGQFRRVLDSVAKDINQNTDLTIEYDVEKIVQTVSYIHFSCRKKISIKAINTDILSDYFPELKARNILKASWKNLDPSIRDEVKLRYTDFDEYIKEKISILDSQVSGSIKHPGRWLFSAISNNFEADLPPLPQEKDQINSKIQEKVQGLQEQITHLVKEHDGHELLVVESIVTDAPGELDFMLEAEGYIKQLYDHKHTPLENFISGGALIRSFVLDRIKGIYPLEFSEKSQVLEIEMAKIYKEIDHLQQGELFEETK
ncbi:MAG: replication initiation protein [Lentisphaeria bacterium]|nr:replication initiation protein [Lentisphaeria bacterium]NQZ70663.1 replication initiation protein [Lentisphaeria bacterium]